MEQYIPESSQLFGAKSLISNHIINLSYISNNLGVRIFKDYERNTIPVSYFIQACYIPSQMEPQFNAGFLYHFNGKDSYIGITGCYFPFLAHDAWDNDNPDYNSQNFLVNTVFSDYTNKLKYGIELTFGSNLSTPISLFQYPENTDFSFFTGGDLHIGYQFEFNRVKWIPMIRYSIRFREISLMEINFIEIRVGNLLKFKDTINIHMDLGFGINTEYYDTILYTRFKFLWGLKLLINL